MTQYALIQDNIVVQVGAPDVWWDGTRWWDFRPDDPATYEEAGWLPVTETPRPADTFDTVFEYSVELIDGVPTEAWTGRLKTDAELQADHMAQLKIEQDVAIAALVPEQTDALLGETAPPAGAAWKQPTGAHDAYPLDWEVSHNEKTWKSTVTANVWEPGVSGWSETGSMWPDWVQPTGAHDAYAIASRVTHNELRWTSDVDGNSWEPGVYGWTEYV